jgi:hypothetical protein
MQEVNDSHDLRQTPQNMSGSFGNVPPALLKTASGLMDRAIAQSHYREVMLSVAPQVLGVPPRE